MLQTAFPLLLESFGLNKTPKWQCDFIMHQSLVTFHDLMIIFKIEQCVYKDFESYTAAETSEKKNESGISFSSVSDRWTPDETDTSHLLCVSHNLITDLFLIKERP